MDQLSHLYLLAKNKLYGHNAIELHVIQLFRQRLSKKKSIFPRLPFGIVTYARFFFFWTTFVETAVYLYVCDAVQCSFPQRRFNDLTNLAVVGGKLDMVSPQNIGNKFVDELAVTLLNSRGMVGIYMYFYT